MKAVFLALLALAVFVTVACGTDSTRDQLRSRVDGFLEAVLNSDVAALDDYVSDGCAKKAEFLELIGASPAFESVDITVPEGSFSFDVSSGVAVAKRIQDSQPLLLNDEILEDDPSNDIPLKLVDEGGVWRVVNCDAYVPE